VNNTKCSYRSVARVAKSEWRPFFLHLAVLGLGAGVLVGCAEQPAPPPPEAAAVPPPQPAAPKPPSHVARHPVHKPTPPPATESPGIQTSAPDADNEALAMTPPQAPVPSPSPTVTPHPQVRELIGLDQPSATRLFGAAVERTEEPPATIWRYKTPTCELDLFFYLDLRSGRMRTLHYTFKGDAADAARRQNCVSELVAARGT